MVWVLHRMQISLSPSRDISTKYFSFFFKSWSCLYLDPNLVITDTADVWATNDWHNAGSMNIILLNVYLTPLRNITVTKCFLTAAMKSCKKMHKKLGSISLYQNACMIDKYLIRNLDLCLIYRCWLTNKGNLQFWQVCSFVGLSVCLSVSLSVLSSITHERFDISSPNLVHIWNGLAVPVCDIDK